MFFIQTDTMISITCGVISESSHNMKGFSLPEMVTLLHVSVTYSG